MLSIDEAIQDFRQLENEFEHYMCDTEDKKENLVKYQREWEYYKQLAEWLEELKFRRVLQLQCEKEFFAGYENGKTDGYKKGIDDFIHSYYEYCEKQYGRLADDELIDMQKVSEKLKDGGTDGNERADT